MERPFCSALAGARRGIGRCQGFTLIEMLVVFAISAILLTLAVPSMRSLIDRNGVANSVNALMSTLSFARAEAMKRGMVVSVCRSADVDTAAMPSCSAGSDWASGWIVFADLNADGAFDANGGDMLLRSQGTLARSGSITQNMNVDLQFLPTGLMRTGASNFLFRPGTGGSTFMRLICLGIVGRARLVNDTASCST
ncbi:type II secretion system protein H [Variovorax sp. SRS16]|uniref:GspH/FimT family pseudopilin n=1 Tax=Variovorax sp. SRS16 TaxID=282217 RepID=UPI00131865D7|nr:GspH/FimT family pseudopilin [Variovorax sp. SRS16]VTU18493.1 type II secretion system protein H [Variovorax sp. SRS16]